MPIQTATIDSIEKGSGTLIGEARYTAEFSAPCIHLIERQTLGHGENTYRFIKFGQASMSALVDGEDMTDSQSFGLTYVDASPSEVGAKFIITDKLARELKPDAYAVAGRMLGDGMGRKRDEDIIALFSALDTAFGADGKYLGNVNAAACVMTTKALKFPNPVYAVHHPNATGYLGMAASVLQAAWAGMPPEFAMKALQNFWTGVRISGVNFFEDGNIAKIAGYDSAYGAMFSKNAMGLVESLAPTTERERDASLRAWELNIVSDYIAVEIDGGYGASMQYEIGNYTTSA